MPSSASPHTSSYGSPGSTSPTHFHSDPSFLYPHEPGGKLGRQRLSSYYSSELMNTLPEKVKSPKTTKQILSNIHLELTASEVPLDVKELYESFEFFLRTRKRLFGAAKRGPSPPLPIEVHDMCCGHGFTGMLFAACSPSLDVHVKLFDQTCPPSHFVIREALERVCPHMKGRVEFVEKSLSAEGSPPSYPSAAGPSAAGPSAAGPSAAGPSAARSSSVSRIVIGVHACGLLTDSVLEYALSNSATSIAVMPCCYTGTNPQAPYGLKRVLGSSWSSDIARIYRLSSNNYHTDFSSIPSSITPMNRIIVAERR
ncbi:hypothetical protein TrCOL_g9249 [Triparma columacea]|uniref:Methyltransferase domain-containing protein n=1 Tax=Triparma columacea TaxID=722753 RepID=A0A9W7LB37_9STRA|nr:hypothetical protein TrCOL_g9249 [Triparma columacea]